MSKKINILLLEDVESLGKAGDVVEVAEGYARNFLFPEGKAALATREVRQQQEIKQQTRSKEEVARLKQLQEKAQALEGTELTMQARVHEGNELYGSITSKEISEQLNKEANLTTNPQDIVLESPLKKVGSSEVTVHLSPDVEFVLHVNVVPDEESEPPRTKGRGPFDVTQGHSEPKPKSGFPGGDAPYLSTLSSRSKGRRPDANHASP